MSEKKSVFPTKGTYILEKGEAIVQGGIGSAFGGAAASLPKGIFDPLPDEHIKTLKLEPGLPRESLVLRQGEIVRVWNEVIEKAAGIAEEECTTFNCRGCTACDIADEIRSHKRSI